MTWGSTGYVRVVSNDILEGLLLSITCLAAIAGLLAVLVSTEQRAAQARRVPAKVRARHAQASRTTLDAAAR